MPLTCQRSHSSLEGTLSWQESSEAEPGKTLGSETAGTYAQSGQAHADAAGHRAAGLAKAAERRTENAAVPAARPIVAGPDCPYRPGVPPGRQDSLSRPRMAQMPHCKNECTFAVDEVGMAIVDPWETKELAAIQFLLVRCLLPELRGGLRTRIPGSAGTVNRGSGQCRKMLILLVCRRTGPSGRPRLRCPGQGERCPDGSGAGAGNYR